MHDPVTPHNFEVQLGAHEGRLVRATVQIHKTVPSGGLRLSVLWDPDAGRVVEVKPYRNLGRFITAELARLAGGGGGH